MSFSIPFEHIADQPAQTALDTVRHASKKPVGELKIYDLIREGDEPSSTRNGVYLFFSPENSCLYVGKNSAQAFVERVPWHFAVWEESWMNHILKRTKERHALGSLIEAANYAADYQLLLIPMGSNDRSVIKPLEKFFRLFLKQTLRGKHSIAVPKELKLDKVVT